MAQPSLPPSQTRLLFRKGFFAFFVTQLLSALNDNFLKNAVVIWISATRASMFGDDLTVLGRVHLAVLFVLCDRRSARRSAREAQVDQADQAR
jgi:hypothetical protein